MTLIDETRTITFKRGPIAEGDEPTWKVIVDGAALGSVVSRHCVLANRGRTLLATGWPQRRGRLWVASVAYCELEPGDRSLIQEWLNGNAREKTNRKAAAGQLLAAYEALGVRLPRRGDPPTT